MDERENIRRRRDEAARGEAARGERRGERRDDKGALPALPTPAACGGWQGACFAIACAAWHRQLRATLRYELLAAALGFLWQRSSRLG